MSGNTRYEKLRNLLREKIVSGKYERGDRFFSQNELMEKYNLSFSTVTRALDDLVRDGFLIRQKGKGTFVNATQAASARNAQQRNIYLFAPWNQDTKGITSTALLYQHLEAIRPEGFLLKFTPHSTGPDDLEPYLFSRDPMDAAVFLNPVQAHRPFIRKLAETVPTVVLSNAPLPLDGQVVYTCTAAAAEMATRHLLNLGHRHIAVLGTRDDPAMDALFVEGYRSALKGAGVVYSESLVAKFDPAFPHSTGFAALADQNSDLEITAVFALSSLAAIEAIAEIRDMGKSVPGDVSLICIDDLGKAQSFPIPTTAVVFPAQDLAEQLNSAINAALEHSMASVTPVGPQLKIRSTTTRAVSVSPPQNKTPRKYY